MELAVDAVLAFQRTFHSLGLEIKCLHRFRKSSSSFSSRFKLNYFLSRGLKYFRCRITSRKNYVSQECETKTNRIIS